MAAASCVFLSRLVTRRASVVGLLRNNGCTRKDITFTLPRHVSSSSWLSQAKKEWLEVTYEKVDGMKFTVKGKEGDNLLDIAVNNDLDLEGFGACEGTLACSTCHLIFKKEDFDLIEEPCTDEELDMLDLAYGLTDTGVCVSLSGSGFLGIYELGAATCLHHHWPGLFERANMAGASAGALLAACLVCSVPVEIIKSGFFETAAHAQKWAMGPFNPNFNIEDYLRLALEALPPDAHTRASGRLFVSITKVTNKENVLVSNWESREELIQCLLCSCFIPLYSGFKFPLFRGTKYIDGCFTNNLPVIQQPAITISPFDSLTDICPKSNSKRPVYVNISNEHLALTLANVVRLVQAMLPPPAEVLESLYLMGYRDAYYFLKKKCSFIRRGKQLYP
ncbi:patatin-like phospholipase domain-containing protein 4 isoform X3 [Cherax quadricarinatus]|uniref:patatin-like phospholipase domain-containing protein 4 isoform X3 n=1 Tax=Cherax quadricarinatus TaxID=27406 RepID=UPI00387E6D75